MPNLPTFAACLLALAALSAVPPAMAQAEPCVSDDGDCTGGNVLEWHAYGLDAEACTIGVNGACDPYSGDLVRTNVEGKELSVPDPCYTTACF